MLTTMRAWLSKTIARKLLLAFFLVFIVTYLVTALVVESAVRSAVTDSELSNLSQLAQIKLGEFNAKFGELETDLHAWAKLDVMNDLVSGDVDKRLEKTLANLKQDYGLNGDIYAFDTTGNLIASSEEQHRTAMLPEAWKTQGALKFVNKHTDPLDGDDIVALVSPVTASFSADYQLGTLVIAYHFSEVVAALPKNALLLRHQDVMVTSQTTPVILSSQFLPADFSDHAESIDLLAATLDMPVAKEALVNLAHQNGWIKVARQPYLLSSVVQNSGLLAGWQVAMLRPPASLQQAVRKVIFKLALLGLLLALPLVFAIYWLSKKLTAPLRTLAKFVSEINGTQDLSKRLALESDDEIGRLAHDFNQMAERVERGSQAHRVAETRLRATIESALDAVVQMDSKGIVTGWNERAADIFGWARDEAMGRLLVDMVIPLKNREEYFSRIQMALMPGATDILSTRVEQTSIHRDGHEFPAEWAITTIEVQKKYELCAFIRDITQQKQSEELIWNQANFDKVTGLPNRHLFHNQLEQEIKKAHRTHSKMALFFIDLDHFKEINDTLGHDAGDILLVEAGKRIRNSVRESDTVARLGGDEFTVLLLDAGDIADIERIAANILKTLHEPFQLGDEAGYISASIGITLYPNDATTVEGMLKNADQAMYVSKSNGRNQSNYYTAALQESAQCRRRIINDLRDALTGDQFVLHFQPIIHLATGRIHKAEALIRWQHPTRGLLAPAEFIVLAEETGLINEIGDWVFYEAARQTQRWVAIAGQDFQMGVNKSPAQFMRDDDHSAWLAYLTQLNLSGRNLLIEITEGLLLNPINQVTDKLFKFRDAGIQVAIDDFGTGYSSLSYLKKFDIDYLKIDKSFIDNIETNANDLILCEAIIVMAHKLGLKVVAEGIEVEAQRKLLSDAGCDYAQGYLFSKPVPAQEFEVLLRANATET